MCKKYQKRYSCGHSTTEVASYCKTAQWRIKRGHAPRPKDCQIHWKSDTHTIWKCADCHGDWKKHQLRYLDDIFDKFLIPQVAAFPDTQRFLSREKDTEKDQIDKFLRHWAQSPKGDVNIYEMYYDYIQTVVRGHTDDVARLTKILNTQRRASQSYQPKSAAGHERENTGRRASYSGYYAEPCSEFQGHGGGSKNSGGKRGKSRSKHSSREHGHRKGKSSKSKKSSKSSNRGSDSLLSVLSRYF